MCESLVLNVDFGDSDGKIKYLKDYEIEKGLKYYFKKDVKGLEDYITKLSNSYEEKSYMFLSAFYAVLIKHENAVHLINKALSENHYISEKVSVYLAYALKNFYSDKENLEKIYTYILKIGYEVLDAVVIFDSIKDYINIVLEAGEWLKNNVLLSKKEKDFINFVLLKLMNYVNAYELKDNEKKDFLKTYIRLLWDARSLLKKENERVFSPLFKGIINAHLNLLNQEDIMNFIMRLGVDEYIARELTNTYIKIKFGNDDGDGGNIDENDIPF